MHIHRTELIPSFYVREHHALNFGPLQLKLGTELHLEFIWDHQSRFLFIKLFCGIVRWILLFSGGAWGGGLGAQPIAARSGRVDGAVRGDTGSGATYDTCASLQASSWHSTRTQRLAVRARHAAHGGQVCSSTMG